MGRRVETGSLNTLWTGIHIGTLVVTDVSHGKARLALLPRQEVGCFNVRVS